MLNTSGAVAVLVCKDLGKGAKGLDLKMLRSTLEGSVPNVVIEVLPDLCYDLGQIAPAIGRHDATGVVLGLCSGDYSHIEVQSRIKKAGLDPFAVEVVALGTWCGSTSSASKAVLRARALLAGAAARVKALRASGPDNTRIQFLPKDQKLTRRALFTVRPVGYRPVPGVIMDRCTDKNGCRLCVEACPMEALDVASRCLTVDKARCGSCGVCLTACPKDALDFPGSLPSQIAAQLSALVDPGHEEPANMLFACQRMAGRLESLVRRGQMPGDRWLPVLLPCLGMITPGWILQVLARGAGSVALFPCETGCTFGLKDVVVGRVDFCQKILSMLGRPASRIRWLGSGEVGGLLESLAEEPRAGWSDLSPASTSPLSLGSADETLAALRSLWDAAHLPAPIALEHLHSPFGVPELRGEDCTGCLACVGACPTGALASTGSDEEREVSLFPSACTGCGRCAAICPERSAGVLRVRKATDLAYLSHERLVLHRVRAGSREEAHCEGCGKVIVSDTLMQRIAAILGEDNSRLGAHLSRYCATCQASLTWSDKPLARV